MTRPSADFALRFDPRDGNGLRGEHITANQFREKDHNRAWMYNPWTGVPRSAADVVENPFMENVAPPFPPIDAPKSIMSLDECCAAEGMTPGRVQFVGAEPVDDVNHPAHYTQGEIECIDAIQAALTSDEYRGYLKGNALKYIWRERHKGQGESIRKAEWYIARMVRSAT